MSAEDLDVNAPRHCTKRAKGRAAARADLAFAYYRQGFGYGEIAKMTGYADRSGARKAVERGRARWLSATDEELRALQLESLDVVEARLMALIDCGAPDLKAIELFLKVWDRRVKLLEIGSRPPVAPTPSGGVGAEGPTKGELVARYSELARKMAADVSRAGYLTPADDEDEREDDDDADAFTVATRSTDTADGGDSVKADSRPPGEWREGLFYPAEMGEGSAWRPAAVLSPEAFSAL
jgi:hypothetical protein